jgi:hypothetical protein
MWFSHLFLLLFSFSAHFIGAPNVPLVIPALQQWTSSSGTFTLTANCIMVSTLTKVMQTFQTDLQSLTQLSCSLQTTNSGPNTSPTFFLSLVAESGQIGPEGYFLDIYRSNVTLTAATRKGVFYGTRTLLQMFKVQGLSIQTGSAVDFPQSNYLVRALMVDMGRLYMDADFLINLVKELAYFKMSYFHWHAGEWQYWRIECESHPEIVASQHLTKVEVNQIVTIAKQYFVQIILETETPGHANFIIDVHPELAAVDIHGNRDPDNLDLTNPAVYTFMSSFYEEYLTLFTTSIYFHLGTDEFITDYSLYPQFGTYAQEHFGGSATGHDLFLYYVNWAANITQSYNKTALVWNDNKQPGNVFSLSKTIIMDGWSGAAISQIEEGYQAINSFQTSLYPTFYGPYTVFAWEPYQRQLYESWQPNSWAIPDPSSLPIVATNPNLIGVKLEFWFDQNNVFEYSAAYLLRDYVRTVAQKGWASPLLTPTYSVFQGFINQVGHAPSTTFPLTTPPVVYLNGPYSSSPGNAVAFSSAGTVPLPDTTFVSYNWNFGDGGYSSLANPTHTYTTAGIYVITLIIQDSINQTGANQTYVNVGNEPTPSPAPGSPSVPPSTPSPPPSPSPPPPPRPPPSPTPTSTNLAFSKPISASSNFISQWENFTANLANDNNLQTRWCATSGSNGQWLKINLGSVFALSRSVIIFQEAGVWRYKIDISLDDRTYTTLVDQTNQNANTQTFTDNFVSTPVQFIRLTITENAVPNWASIFEFQLFT